MNYTLEQIAGWSAYVNGFTSIISTVFLVIFFIAGGLWGLMNDSISIVWMLSFIPLAILLYQWHKPVFGSLSLIITVLGVAAMLTFVGLQMLLVLRVVTFEQTFSAVLVTTLFLGAWLVVHGLVSQQKVTLPAGLSWVTIALGATYIIAAIGFLVGGWENPIAVGGFLLGAVLAPVWSFWLGRLLLQIQVTVTA